MLVWSRYESLSHLFPFRDFLWRLFRLEGSINLHTLCFFIEAATFFKLWGFRCLGSEFQHFDHIRMVSSQKLESNLNIEISHLAGKLVEGVYLLQAIPEFASEELEGHLVLYCFSVV